MHIGQWLNRTLEDLRSKAAGAIWETSTKARQGGGEALADSDPETESSPAASAGGVVEENRKTGGCACSDAGGHGSEIRVHVDQKG